MADDTYTIVFAGKVLPGHEVADVKVALGTQFKLSADQVNKLFSGRRSVLKKGLDAAGSARFESALNNIGAAVLVEIGDASPSPAPAATGGSRPPPPPPPPPPPAGSPGAPTPAPPPLEMKVADPDPYRPPSATLSDVAEGDDELHEPRLVSIGRGMGWISDGWGYFKDTPGQWIGIWIVMFLSLMVPGIIPGLGALITIFLTPVLMAGVMLGAEKQRRGGALEVGDLFSGFKQRLGPLFGIGAVYLGGTIVTTLMMAGAAFATVGGTMMTSMPDFNSPGDEAVILMIIVIVLLVFAMTIPLMMLIWFAPALVVLHDMPLGRALKMSFMGCLKNILPFLLYGILALIFVFVATIPALLGWLVFGPVILASVYASYRDIYVD